MIIEIKQLLGEIVRNELIQPQQQSARKTGGKRPRIEFYDAEKEEDGNRFIGDDVVNIVNNEEPLKKARKVF